MSNEELMQQLKKAVLDGEEIIARDTAMAALEAGMGPLEVVNASIQPAMNEIGDQYRDGLVYLPELVLASDAAKLAMEVLMSHV